VIESRLRTTVIVYGIALIVFLLAASDVIALGAESSIEKQSLQIAVNPKDGSYTIAMPRSDSPALRAGVAVEVNGRWLHAADYPQHAAEHSQSHGELGETEDWKVTYSGLTGQPDLI